MTRIAAALSWLGRQGTRAVAALIVIGIAMPSVGALLKPFVTAAVFLLLCIAFLLVDAAAFKIYLGRPMVVLAATAWTSLLIPAFFGATYLTLGLNDQSPDLFLALVLQAIASPLMAAPAFAALMRLDATLVLCTMVTSTALAGSALVGLTMRWFVGPTAIERQKEAISGFNILVLFVFVAAVMESVAARLLSTPMITIGLAALAFVVFFAGSAPLQSGSWRRNATWG
jgi:hypothetical protein